MPNSRLSRFFPDINRNNTDILGYATIDRYTSKVLYWHFFAFIALAFLNSYGRLAERIASPLSLYVIDHADAILLSGLAAAATVLPLVIKRAIPQNHYIWRIAVAVSLTSYAALFTVLSGYNHDLYLLFLVAQTYLIIYTDWRLGLIHFFLIHFFLLAQTVFLPDNVDTSSIDVLVTTTIMMIALTFSSTITYHHRMMVSNLERAKRRINKELAVQERLQQEISELAFKDPLTKLLNRTAFFQQLETALKRSRPQRDLGALLFIDLDKFKAINDTYGHQAGDAVLQEVAERLRESVREQDLVARIGGDEFVILLPQIHEEEEAVTIAERIIAASAQPVVFRKNRLKANTSVGIAYFPEKDLDSTTLINRADGALYQAKKQGHGTYARH